MKLLLIHHSFPAQFGRLLTAMAAQGLHQLVFITHAGQQRAAHPGVTVVPYLFRSTSFRTHPNARGFDEALRRADAVADVARGLHAAGFMPDLVIGHEGWGDTLDVCDVWPGVPQLGYREYFYHETGADVGCDPEFPLLPGQAAGARAKNAVGLLSLLQGHDGISPTAWQRSLYPDWAQPRIHVVPDAVDLATCRPDPACRRRLWQLGGLTVAPDTELITFVARDLEPYRGFHTLMRALPALLTRPGLQVVCLGNDKTTYGPPPPTGSWRDWLLAEMGDRIDPTRLHFPGWVAHADYIRLLQRSDVHTYLSYPFFASWSLREALACGCVLVASDTAAVREFVTDGETGVLAPPLDSAATADAVLALLDDAPRRARLSAAARQWAERELRPALHLDGWRRVIQAVCGHDLNG